MTRGHANLIADRASSLDKRNFPSSDYRLFLPPTTGAFIFLLLWMLCLRTVQEIPLFVGAFQHLRGAFVGGIGAAATIYNIE